MRPVEVVNRLIDRPIVLASIAGLPAKKYGEYKMRGKSGAIPSLGVGLAHPQTCYRPASLCRFTMSRRSWPGR